LGTRGIPARYGGFETFAEQLAVRLVEHGLDVTVYAEADGPAPPDATYRGVRIRYRRRPRWGAASVIAYDCACLWDARRGYDLVYMLGYGAAWACWWPRMAGTPVWINVDGLEWARSKWSWPARLYLRVMEWMAPRTASHLIADAEAIAQRFRRLYPRAAPCTTIAYGAELVDPQRIDPASLARWRLTPGHYALVVARPEPENHVLEIIQGHCIYDGDWPLVIVGDVSGATAYQRRLLALRSERVHFLGAIYDPVLLTALRVHAGVYLHGHSVGGTNPSLLESMACGSPIIAHDNPFNREVAGDAALYFRCPKEIADGLARTVGSSQTRDPLWPQRVALARQRIVQTYNWSRIVSAYVNLIDQSGIGPRCQRERAP
jgi:glycosyltransferase involved in cell wall biosynthesis